MSIGPDRYARYWRANVRLIAGFLTVWALASIVCSILLVETLNRFSFFGLPLGFWVAQQGAIILFVLLIFLYAWRMDRLDRDYHADE